MCIISLLWTSSGIIHVSSSAEAHRFGELSSNLWMIRINIRLFHVLRPCNTPFICNGLEMADGLLD